MVGEFRGYPIDSLQVGQSFHIPETVDDPSPAKLGQSIIDEARAKYGVLVVGAGRGQKLVPARDFIVATVVGADDPNGPGARVWRTR